MHSSNYDGSHSGRQRCRMPLSSTRITAIVSVAMVLLLGGIAAMLALAASAVVRDLREQMGFVVVMSDDATAKQIDALKQRFTRSPYVSSYSYASPEEVLDRWQQMLGEDEPIQELLDGVNPFAPEFEVHVKAAYVHADTLERLVMPIRRAPGVESVRVHSHLVTQVNHTVRTVTWVLVAVAAVLLIISIVLINNTVRLTIYARRFTIYTMRLVGATGSFIRRPIVLANLICGFIAGTAASGLLALGLWQGSQLDAAMPGLVSWTDAAIVMGVMVVAGMLICVVTATAATNRQLRRRHADLFK